MYFLHTTYIDPYKLRNKTIWTCPDFTWANHYHLSFFRRCYQKQSDIHTVEFFIILAHLRHIQKLIISKKSTFFVLPSRNFVKIITSWGNHFHKVSWELDKIVDFFLMPIFWTCPFLFAHILYKFCRSYQKHHWSLQENLNSSHFNSFGKTKTPVRIGHYWDLFLIWISAVGSNSKPNWGKFGSFGI